MQGEHWASMPKVAAGVLEASSNLYLLKARTGLSAHRVTSLADVRASGSGDDVTVLVVACGRRSCWSSHRKL